ncbi:hypothetical protein [Tautonia rosea]|uniref:hypothetical protein n=1 Tax=Tautonia rosea TaxID=2728037 RepID=UPI0014741AFA|nr:hypothetical protein [Tautonia rosea]
MKIKLAISVLFVLALGGGLLASRNGSATSPKDLGTYKPMEPMEDDPNAGGMQVAIGNGVVVESVRRAFPSDRNGNLEVAVQYQIKLPVGYDPGGEICRLRVQSVVRPGCCGGDWKLLADIPLEPFVVGSGEHLNDVVVVKVPPPRAERGSVRAVLETLQADGEWKSEAGKTIYVYPL